MRISAKLVLMFVLCFSITAKTMASEGSEQNTRKYSKISVGKKFSLAKKLMKEGGYITAAQYLEEYNTKKPNKHKALYLAAKANEILRDYSRAENYYKLLLDVKPSKYPLARFDYARMLKMNGKYDEARKNFSQFSSEYDGDNKSQYQNWVKKEIEGCDWAKEALKKLNPRQKVQHLNEPINNELTEFAPKWISDKKLLYSSFPNDTAVNLTTFWKNKKDYRTKIYMSNGNAPTAWEKGQLVDGVNDPKFHCGNAVISDDGNTMYFTKCSEDKTLNMICKIYSSKKEGDKWGEPKELPINVNDAGVTTTQPALGKDANGNNILYFISNRPGGIGGLDIWITGLDKNGTPGNVKNLGNTINTFGDEWSPFYDNANNKLYFSSNGHKNMGGMDIYSIKGNTDMWDTITNLGAPVNSSADDIYLALDKEGEQGYIISNRQGTTSPRGATCCDDIFYVYLGGKKVWLNGTYAQKGDPKQTPLAGVDNTLYSEINGAYERVNSGVTGTTSFVYELKPGMKYKINGTKEGFYPGVDNFETPAKIKNENDTITQVFFLNPILKNKVKVENVYFVYDKSALNKENSTQRVDSIASFLKQNANYGVEITGHTDNKGSDAYNDALSKRRAQTVSDYLIKTQSLEKDRVMVKGMGEKMPIAPNEFPDGRDNPEGRAKNRRVEFKLISDDNKIEIIYDNGGPAGVE